MPSTTVGAPAIFNFVFISCVVGRRPLFLQNILWIGINRTMNHFILVCLLVISTGLVLTKGATDCASKCQSNDYCMFSCTLLSTRKRQDFSDPATCYSSCKGDTACEDICRITLETGK
ncbi:hypothetical protein Btru_033743 [Bulinus truncatus]|nr:hypothetical protein Btru_033743 [Bulinus truncatus]